MKHRVVGVLAIATVIVAGCGGGSDESAAGNLAEFCRLSNETDSSTSLPSSEELAQFVDAAPGEVRDDVRVVVDAVNDVEDPDDVAELIAAFEEPEVVESIQRIEAFEARNCD